MSIKISKSIINANAITFIDHGRKEITGDFKEQVEKFKIGSLIAYETIDGRYTKGGFITEFHSDYLVWITLDFERSYKIRYHNVKRMWLGDVFEVEGDYVGFKKPAYVTNHGAKIGEYPIRYFKDKHTRNVFLASNKYQTMVKWHNFFIKNEST